MQLTFAYDGLNFRCYGIVAEKTKTESE